LKLTRSTLKSLINEVKSEKSMLLEAPVSINEMASFSRARNHIENRGIEFVMISAYRGGKEQQGNRERHKQMKMVFKGAGYPFIDMLGGYSEEEHGDVTEPSLLVLSDDRPDAQGPRPPLFKLAAQVAKRYDQDSFIFGQPAKTADDQPAYVGTGGTGDRPLMDIRAYDQQGQVISEPWAGPWNNLVTAKEDDIYWSVVAGKKGKLAEARDKFKNFKPSSRTEAMKKDFYLKASTSGIKFLLSKNEK